MIKLYPHQNDCLSDTNSMNRVAYYLDMGLGKTFVGSEKLKQLSAPFNILVCQKSKVEDWINHFQTYYDLNVIDYTKNKSFQIEQNSIIIINYDLIWRRPEILALRDFTLMLDESSYIKNPTSKRTKFIMKMRPTNVILLSGTPTGGKYEELWSQCRLLGWTITKKEFYNQYIITRKVNINNFPVDVIIGYKNVEDLKRQLRKYGAVFMKTEEVIDLPSTISTNINIKCTTQYKKFEKDRLIEIDGAELVGDTTLTYLLYLRQLAGGYNKNKASALMDLLESTLSRVVVFYNFNNERDVILDVCKKLNRPVSIINGSTKDLSSYHENDNTIIICQYQAAAMGLNLQKANHLVYFTLPLSSELFEQSKKRIHRLGQEKTCFYYYLLTDKSVEHDILTTLKTRKDYTDRLFKKRR